MAGDSGAPGLLQNVPGPPDARCLRAHHARGVHRGPPGSLHLPAPHQAVGVDHLPHLSVGPQLRKPRGLQPHAGGDALPGQPGSRGPAPRRRGLHLEEAGHELPEPARGAPDHPGVQQHRQHRRARNGLQIRGDRPSRRGAEVHRPERVSSVLQPSAHGAALGGPGHARRPRAADGDAAGLSSPRRVRLGQLRTLPRRHRVGVLRRRRAGRPGSIRSSTAVS